MHVVSTDEEGLLLVDLSNAGVLCLLESRPITLLKEVARRSTRKSLPPVAAEDRAIPPPPPLSPRPSHQRPFSPALVASRSSNAAASQSPALLQPKSAQQPQEQDPLDDKPWATQPVDRLICVLDAQGYDYEDIIDHVRHKVKIAPSPGSVAAQTSSFHLILLFAHFCDRLTVPLVQFPALQTRVITIDMLHCRLAMLDYRIELDYFSKGMKKAEKKAKRAREARAAEAFNKAEARRRRKGKGKATEHFAQHSDSVATSPNWGAEVDVNEAHGGSDMLNWSRGARHGKAIAERSNVVPHGESTGMASLLASSVEHTTDVDHKIEEEREPEGPGHVNKELQKNEQCPTMKPIFNNLSKSNGYKGRGIEHGKAIHHDRDQSNVSSTVTGTTAVNLSTADDTRSAPEGLVYTRPVTPTTSEVSTAGARKLVSSSLPLSSLQSLPPVEDEAPQSRAAKLGRAIHSPATQSWIPTPKGKLRVVNGLNKDELLTSPRSTPTSNQTLEEAPPASSSPAAFKRKRSVDKMTGLVAKENQAQTTHHVSKAAADGDDRRKNDTVLVSQHHGQGSDDNQSSTKADVVHDLTSSDRSRKSHEIAGSPKAKVGNLRRAATPVG
ncbi:MAG: hypothetical protein Q9162_003971 [Coniocarpon cinnabarinum]